MPRLASRAGRHPGGDAVMSTAARPQGGEEMSDRVNLQRKFK
jgi:hypothetical protein